MSRRKFKLKLEESTGVNLDNEILSIVSNHINQSPDKAKAAQQVAESLLAHGCQCVQKFTGQDKAGCQSTVSEVVSNAFDWLFDSGQRGESDSGDASKN